MDFITLASLQLLLVAALLVAIVVVARRRAGSTTKVRERNAAWLGAGPEFEVAMLASSDLEQPEQAPRRAQAGVLVLASDRVRFAGSAPLSGRDVLAEIDPANARARLFRAPWYATGLRDLVRVETPEGCRYFFARRALGQPDERKTRQLFEALAKRMPRSSSGDPPAPAPAGAYVATAVFVLAIAGGLFALLRTRPDTGPWTLAADANGAVAAATEREILRFDSGGKLARRDAFAALGLAHAPAQLAFGRDGALYAADRESAAIYRCAGEPGGACAKLFDLPREAKPGGTFKFALDASGARFVVTEAEDDRVLLLDRDGRLLDSLERKRSDLCFPNGVAIGADGRAYVADTNNFRIAAFALDGDKLSAAGTHAVAASREGAPGAECDGIALRRALPRGHATALEGARRGRVWPAALAQDARGHWWVVLANAMLAQGDVLELDENFASPRVRTLGERNDPVAVAAVGDAVWIGDTESPGIHVARAGAVDALADADFAAFMARVADAKARYRVLRAAAPIVGIVMLTALLVFALLASRRRIAAILRSEPARA